MLRAFGLCLPRAFGSDHTRRTICPRHRARHENRCFGYFRPDGIETELFGGIDASRPDIRHYRRGHPHDRMSDGEGRCPGRGELLRPPGQAAADRTGTGHRGTYHRGRRSGQVRSEPTLAARPRRSHLRPRTAPRGTDHQPARHGVPPLEHQYAHLHPILHQPEGLRHLLGQCRRDVLERRCQRDNPAQQRRRGRRLLLPLQGRHAGRRGGADPSAERSGDDVPAATRTGTP